MSRNAKEIEITNLLVACGGRCTICNEDVIHDWLSQTDMRSFERAHIKSFSDNGVRADVSLCEVQRNSVDNIILLCGDCHGKIDKWIAEEIYTVEWLLKRKLDKQAMIRQMMKTLDVKDCLFVKYSSPIGGHSFVFDNKDLFRSGFNNGFHSRTGEMLAVCDSANSEDVARSVKHIDDLFAKRVQIQIDDNQAKPICLFGLAPQHLLIYLGSRFNDKLDVTVFTKHRSSEIWIYDNEKDNPTTFKIHPPTKPNVKNNAALVIGITDEVGDHRVHEVLGVNTDIWKIAPSEVGRDTIHTQAEIYEFQQRCVQTVNQIGGTYGKGKEVHVFPAMCNSLAITFGRALFAKSHNSVKVYDAVKSKSGVIFEYRLTI